MSDWDDGGAPMGGDDDSGRPEVAHYRYASELFEDRIAREYGEQYTQAKIDEDIEALEKALTEPMIVSAYFFDQDCEHLWSCRVAMVSF